MEQKARPAPLILLATVGLAVMVSCGVEPDRGSLDTGPFRGDPATSVASGVPAPGSTAPVATEGSPPTQSTSPVDATVVPATTGAPALPGGRLALDLLASITIAREVSAGYDRDMFGGWIDADGDGCNTREEVLMSESVGEAQVDPFGCTVVAGDWFSVYDGATWTDPSDVDIDHVVALKEAWDSGAHGWSPARRRAFANDLSDPRSLRAVTDNVNQSKGDADPSNWLPSRDSFICTYVSDWVAIKAHWGLTMDESEYGRLRNLLRGQCAGATAAPWN